MLKNWSGNNRSRIHDYKSRCRYHITLLKEQGLPDFGVLTGDYRLPVGSPGSSHIEASPLGKAIKKALRLLPSIHPALHLFQYALMPDHLHLVLQVDAELDEPLGRKLVRFKNIASSLAKVDRIFRLGYNDQILFRARSLDAVFRYLRENPYRLAVRRACPDFFRRSDMITIAGRQFSAYGNLHLLDNPFKEQVVVHRADSNLTRAANRDRWLHVVANGGVLVSPFISPAEKEIRKMAEDIDGRIILISNEGFGDRQKPAGNDFARCCRGNLLILTPAELASTPPKPLTRADCLAMNALAALIK